MKSKNKRNWIKIKNSTIIEGLKKVKNPCRFEYIKEKNLIIDASHNPNGIQALRDNLDYYFPNENRRFVFGCLKTKDYKQMIEDIKITLKNQKIVLNKEIDLDLFNFYSEENYLSIQVLFRY